MALNNARQHQRQQAQWHLKRVAHMARPAGGGEKSIIRNHRSEGVIWRK